MNKKSDKYELLDEEGSFLMSGTLEELYKQKQDDEEDAIAAGGDAPVLKIQRISVPWTSWGGYSGVPKEDLRPGYRFDGKKINE